jgi:hypothetical protein
MAEIVAKTAVALAVAYILAVVVMTVTSNPTCLEKTGSPTFCSFFGTLEYAGDALK